MQRVIMKKVLSAVGNVAYNTASWAGLAAGTEQPPYPCAVPWRKIDDLSDTAAIDALAEEIYAAGKDMQQDPAWSIVDYRDPDAAEGGDLFLFTKPHVGPFNFAKATMTLLNCPVEKIIQVMHSEDIADRQRCSADLTGFEILAKPTPSTNLQRVEYWAPPPVAAREFCFLVGRKYDEEEDTTYIYGCSVDFVGCPKSDKINMVRGSCMWMWELTPIGPNTIATYVSALNPRGWTPTFVIGWLKTEIAKELVASRSLLYGIDFKVEKLTAEDLGLTMEELEIEKAAISREADSPI
ncbi:Hypothetical protein, putative [Bodo saltans]|uniref:START domain-containing protein n=1 Tax=Bodo saltans TaxID=75058 RepID=A0A0S4KHG7_BODSA|nr:Hypothetical protein, putative [Bodo saltans]|eukprot:CUI15117.1 Hypothetical protein, putative [Bodo saltans]